MSTFDTISPVPALPNPHGMLSPEVAVQIGCAECPEEIAGTYVATIADRIKRQLFVEDVTTAAEVLEVPTEVRLSSRTHQIGETAQDCGNCALSGACSDDFRQVLASYFPRNFNSEINT